MIALRREHHRLGKKKLSPILNDEGFKVSVPYVGRVLLDLKNRGLLPAEKKLSLCAKTGKLIERKPVYRRKLRRPKGKKQGLEIDTVVRFVDGTKRYVITAIDVETRFAFAGAYTTHTSATTADFLRKLQFVMPTQITEVQSDNGSEFAFRFREACEQLKITHYHTYPRSPKMNAHIERFNRTISEQFIMRNRPSLRDDLTRFNERLVDWLLWYNTKRPHESLGMLPPLRYIVRHLPQTECQKYWTRTQP
jgi:transposase InsO family protein